MLQQCCEYVHHEDDTNETFDSLYCAFSGVSAANGALLT
jgi:hypothetical protein